jgi:hypothetical protein
VGIALHWVALQALASHYQPLAHLSLSNMLQTSLTYSSSILSNPHKPELHTMFSNLQIRPAKPHRRKTSLTTRAGVSKRRISNVNAATANNVPSMSFMEGLFGEEFPDAFGSGPAKSRKTILDLPTELFAIVSEQISGLEIKQLRLASKDLANKVDLRIDRVYISPNRANLDYLQRILNHPRYKGRVREIVWDDAQLDEYPTLDVFCKAILNDEKEATRAIEKRLEDAIEAYENDSPEYRSLGHHDLFHSDGRLTDVAKGILLRYDDQFSRDMLARNAMMMSIEDSYTLYQDLYRDEQDIIKQQSDAVALHQALAGFPNLRRITITSEVWRPWHRVPRYNTPFFRSLPPGFRKPAVWPWLFSYHDARNPRNFAYWHKMFIVKDRLSVAWRGYDIMVSAMLAMTIVGIEEFIIDSGNERTGISHRVLFNDVKNFHDTVQMFQRTPLKRLKLSINPMSRTSEHPLEMMMEGLTHALAQTQHLEHLDLDFNCCARTNNEVFFLQVPPIDFPPTNLKQQLKTLAMRHVEIDPNRLYKLLTGMQNLEQVTLVNINTFRPLGWNSLFRGLSQYYVIASVSKPAFTVVEPLIGQNSIGLYSQAVDVEVDAFIYAEGESPFTDDDMLRTYVHTIKKKIGWRVNNRDESDRVRMCEVHEHVESEWENGMLTN